MLQWYMKMASSEVACVNFMHAKAAAKLAVKKYGWNFIIVCWTCMVHLKLLECLSWHLQPY